MVTAAAQGFKLVSTLGSAAVLARLISPSDYGLANMVTAVTGLLLVFNDVGFSLATIQKQSLTDSELSSAFWLQALVSSVIAGIAAGLAPLLAWVYDQPAVLGLALALAPSFLLAGLYAQHQALLRRGLRYRLVSAIDLGSHLAAIAAAVFVAYLGGGYWALVAQPLVQQLVSLPLFWWACSWRPSAPSLASAGAHISFGSGFTGYKILEYLAKNADRILLGLFAGPHELGLYSRALSLLTLPVTQVTAPLTLVLLPALSSAQRDEAEYRRVFLGGTTVLAWGVMPLAAFVFVAAPDLVYLLLGDDWTGSVGVFRWSSPGALAIPMMALTSWLFLSLGRTDKMWRFGLASALLSVPVVAVAASWGASAVALGRSVVSVAALVFGVAYAASSTFVGAGAILRAVRWPLGTAVVAMTAGLVSAPYLSALSPPARFAVQAGLVLAISAVGLAGSGDHRRMLRTIGFGRKSG